MNWLHSFTFFLQIIAALLIIALVLIQQGSGGDMGTAFGSSASASLFGASGSANFLSRATAILAAIFFSATLVLTYLSSHKPELSVGVLGITANTASKSISTSKGSLNREASKSSQERSGKEIDHALDKSGSSLQKNLLPAKRGNVEVPN